MLQAVDASLLDGGELAGIIVVLDRGKALDHKLIAAHEGQTPAGHVVGLGQGVDFHAHVLGARGGKEAQGLAAVEGQGAVGGVGNHDDVVFLGEAHHFLEKGRGGRRARGVVGVVDVEELGAAALVSGQRVEVGQEIVFRQKRQVDHLAAQALGGRAHDRVAGHGHDGDVAGVDEGQRQQGQDRLGADAVDHLACRVDAGHAVDVGHVAGGGILENLYAVVGVAAVFGLARLGAQHLDHLGRGHPVGFADAEVNELYVGVGGQSGLLGPLDLLELVQDRVLAELVAADAGGEKLLDIAFVHGVDSSFCDLR